MLAGVRQELQVGPQATESDLTLSSQEPTLVQPHGAHSPLEDAATHLLRQGTDPAKQRHQASAWAQTKDNIPGRGNPGCTHQGLQERLIPPHVEDPHSTVAGAGSQESGLLLPSLEPLRSRHRPLSCDRHMGDFGVIAASMPRYPEGPTNCPPQSGFSFPGAAKGHALPTLHWGLQLLPRQRSEQVEPK